VAYKDKEKQRAAGRAYYERNKEKINLYSQARRADLKQRITAIKESTPCTDCGNSYPAVCMDFDHIEDNKIANVATLAANGALWLTIQEEIQKCELVCANCHRLRTQSRLSK